MNTALAALMDEVVACNRCPRLRAHCREVASLKRRAYRDWDYWGKPVPSFGDPAARLLIVGLAPGAHGANRTGRMFTGDSSGDYLYRALHAAGFANQPTSVSAGDGLKLRDAYIAASARCAPPDNKPSREELSNCRPFLERELDLLRNVKVVVALGRIGFETCLGVLKDRGRIESRSTYQFAHNRLHQLPGQLPALIASYHPSRQNTSTGRLTDAMLLDVFRQAALVIESASPQS
ncbi:MAG: uracil-DNA glycosylase [Bryobacteraceae bacterium]|nr:uracil-DNA glycosylase [Bryobacteraceae bacterium]